MRIHATRLIVGLALQLFALQPFVRSTSSIGWLVDMVIVIPMFLVASYLLLTSGPPLPIRLALTLWPLTIPLAQAAYEKSLEALQWQRVRTEVFLIPAGYHGRVEVIFDVPNGAQPVREGRNTVFPIEPEGTLYTSGHSSWFRLPAVNEAIDRRREFYFVEKSGKRTRIPLYKEGQPRGQRAVYWTVSYANFQPVGGILEESRYTSYWFSVESPEEHEKWW